MNYLNQKALRVLVALLLCGLTTPLVAQSKAKQVAIFTKTDYFANQDIALLAAEQMCEVSGLSHFTTTSLNEATQAKMIILATQNSNTNFLSNSRSDTLKAYLNQGGILLLSGEVISTNFINRLDLKLSIARSSAKRYYLNWDKTYKGGELRWIDHPTEWESLVNSTRDESITYRTMEVIPNEGSLAEPLAHYENGEIAAFKLPYGEGYLYYIGVNMRDVAGRQLLGLNNMKRAESNEVDVAADGFLYLPRAIYETHCSDFVVKHTLPAIAKGALIVTHDVDSKTGIDSMYFYSQYEEAIGYKGHYFVTTSMRRDSRGYNFYVPEKLPLFQEVYHAGHTFGSHSVSHFPDMNRTDFPRGYSGQYHRDNYEAVYNDGRSTGGTMWGELEISRDVLEEDLGVTINSFRAGHLAIHKNQPAIMDSLGYVASSNLMSRQIRTSFPYQQRSELRTSGMPLDSLFEYPLFISDVEYGLETDEFIHGVGGRWKVCVAENLANYAPSVLLIHPNRRLKYLMQKALIEWLPEGVYLYNFVDFTHYWASRYQVQQVCYVQNDTLYVELSQPFSAIHVDISFLVPSSQKRPICVVYADGHQQAVTPVPFDSFYNLIELSSETHIVEPKILTAIHDSHAEITKAHIKYHAYESLISVPTEVATTATYAIYTPSGVLIKGGAFDELGFAPISDLPRGFYLISVRGKQFKEAIHIVR